jgi:TrpR-related protein YerC/YecD
MKCIVSHEDNVEECSDFFEDLCTVAELKAMAQRLHVARMLQRGISTAT